MSRDTNFIFLPSDKNLLRLESCDFHLEENTETSQTNEIQCCLKKILNPTLILFYYNHTSKKILTEFFKASRETELERGKGKDNYRQKKLLDSETEFKFASVNLDYEEDLFKVLTKIEDGNPFKWLEIVTSGVEKTGDDDIDELKELEKNKYPFLVFYYQSIPQYLYEGKLSSESLSNEFRNWYKELMEEKQERRKNTNSYFDGIYIAVDDGQLKNSLADDDPKNFKFNKGEIFRIKVYNDKIFVSRDFSNIGDNSLELNYNEESLRSFFRKIDTEKKNEINESQLEIYKDMYKISHPGDNKKKKKQIYLDYDFFATERGEDREKETSESFIDLFSEVSGKDKFMTPKQLNSTSNKQREKLGSLELLLESKKDVEELLNIIDKDIKSARVQIESLKSIRLLREKEYQESPLP